MKENRDRSILQHIIEYCERAEDTADYFNCNYDTFLESHVFRDAVALCVLQIGELSGILSDEFRSAHNAMPWRQIKALRNIVAHKYGTVDAELLWEILNNDIPELKGYCKQTLLAIGDQCKMKKDSDEQGTGEVF